MNQEFDRRLGIDFLKSVPKESGVYLFKDSDAQIIYVGKAKDLRARLSQYRLASSKKKHRKMRAIVKKLESITYQVCASEKEALLLENQLIQTHRPLFNVVGAFSFLYPYLGLKFQAGTSRLLSICYTTGPERLESLGFDLYGAYRSRDSVSQAFNALSYLLPFLGHLDPSERKAYGKLSYSRIVVFRQVEEHWHFGLHSLFRGESADILDQLIMTLLEKPGARRVATKVQDHLKGLKFFYTYEAVKLRLVLAQQGISASRISQDERDRLFIASQI